MKEDNFSDEVKRAIRKEKLARDVKTHSTAGWTADNRDILRQSLINKKSQSNKVYIYLIVQIFIKIYLYIIIYKYIIQ